MMDAAWKPKETVILRMTGEDAPSAYRTGGNAVYDALFSRFQAERKRADKLLIAAKGAGCISALLLAARFEVDGMLLFPDEEYAQPAHARYRRIAERGMFAVIAKTQILVRDEVSPEAFLAAVRLSRGMPGCKGDLRCAKDVSEAERYLLRYGSDLRVTGS